MAVSGTPAETHDGCSWLNLCHRSCTQRCTSEQRWLLTQRWCLCVSTTTSVKVFCLQTAANWRERHAGTVRLDRMLGTAQRTCSQVNRPAFQMDKQKVRGSFTLHLKQPATLTQTACPQWRPDSRQDKFQTHVHTLHTHLHGTQQGVHSSIQRHNGL